MRPRHAKKYLLALLLFIPIGLLQVGIDYQRKVEDLESDLLLLPGQVAGNLVLGGFKGLAADLLWLNMEEYWHSGQHHKVLPLLETISWLQPNYVLVWAIGGWHMAYNIYAAVENDPEQQAYWYDQGIRFLKKGIYYNPDKYDLYFELGWTYYHKGKDFPNAVTYLAKAAQYSSPDYVTDVLAHAYEKAGNIPMAIETWQVLIDKKSSFSNIAVRMIHDLKTKGKATP